MRTISNNPRFVKEWGKIKSELKDIENFCHKDRSKTTLYELAEIRVIINILRERLDDITFLTPKDVKDAKD